MTTLEDINLMLNPFLGEAVATAPVPAWPNVSFHDSVFRWEDEQGRVAHATYQEVWFDDYHQSMRNRSRAARALGA